MNNRFLLYVAFSLVVFMIWQQWQIEQNPGFADKNLSEHQEESFVAKDLPEEAYEDRKIKQKKHQAKKIYKDPQSLQINTK